MTRLALEVLKALHGDCLLLHHDQELILVDGGPDGVYEATLGPRLEALMQERGEPLFLRMVMVSHIDDDHIVGLAQLFADAAEREEEQRGARRWSAGELWLNAFHAITGAGRAEAPGPGRSAALDALTARAAGAESVAIATSVPSGNALLRDAGALGVPVNRSAGGGLVEAGAEATVVDVVPGLTLTVLAPASPRLADLREKWEAWESRHPQAAADAAANVDRSVFNLSSIVVLARAGERSILFTGDARSDDVVDGLEGAGLLAAGGPPLHVDVLKLPHHGSVRNVDATFFARVRARHYVISADGRDGNPDDGALALLCDAHRGDPEPWTLWLTYGGTPADGKPGLHERLAAFFAARTAAGQEVDVRFAAPDAGHTIEL